jgi:hypothetical protein
MSGSVTDEEIQEVAATAKPFSAALLRWAPDRHQDGAAAIELEHQRRMVTMRRDGIIAVLCPAASDDLAGIAIMTVTADEATEIMAVDPCVQAGMMRVEVYSCFGFPGDSLPG